MISSGNNFMYSSFMDTTGIDAYPTWFKNERYYLCDNFNDIFRYNPKRKKKGKKI